MQTATRARKSPVNAVTTTTPPGLLGRAHRRPSVGRERRIPGASCLITNTVGLKSSAIDQRIPRHRLICSAREHQLGAPRRHRLDKPPATLCPVLECCWWAGVSGLRTERRADASPGEEPVDLAVSVAPSLEVVGDNADQQDRSGRPHPLRDKGQGRKGLVAVIVPTRDDVDPA